MSVRSVSHLPPEFGTEPKRPEAPRPLQDYFLFRDRELPGEQGLWKLVLFLEGVRKSRAVNGSSHSEGALGSPETPLPKKTSNSQPTFSGQAFNAQLPSVNSCVGRWMVSVRCLPAGGGLDVQNLQSLGLHPLSLS